MAVPQGRPQSRGLGPMPMGPGVGTMRPGTSLLGGNPMMGATMGPGGLGALQGRPPPTGARMGTANRTRQGTAAQGGPVIGVGALTEVQIADRPMTMQGVMGMKTGAMGPKRQIYDKTYYLVELRRRCQELADEVTKLNKEINDIQQSNQLYGNLERRYDTLVKTVRALEGDLADHNLATDKQRTDTRPEEVHHMYTIMKTQNEQQRNDVDQIFMERRSHEDEISEMEREIQAMARQAEERLNELHPDQRREYEDLREESGRLSRQLADSRDDLEQVSGRLMNMEGRLRGDVLHSRYQHLNQVRGELEGRLNECRQELQQCSMSVPEQREILLAKVKSDNTEIVAAEKNASELRMEIEKLKAQIREVQADAQERKDESSEQQKYEILFTKDQEMTQFIEAFPQSKADEEKRLKDKQDLVVMLLENISKSLNLPTEVSPEAQLRDMEDELDYKSKQLQNAETTQSRLEGELAKRAGELEKIESLDVKISVELQQVEEKMQQYEQEIEMKLDRVDDMRSAGEQQLRSLEVQRLALQDRSAGLRQQINFLKLKLDTRKQQLADDEAAKNLEEKEQKMRQFGQTLYAVRSFIQQKTSESNYEQEMSNCLTMASQINKFLQEAVMKPVPIYP